MKITLYPIDVGYLSISAICTVLSFIGLQYWIEVSYVKLKSDGLMGENLLHPSVANRVLELLLSSYTTVALVVNFVINIFVLIILSLKCVIVHLSLGGEVLWAGQRCKSSLGYAARYNIDNMVASGQITSTELLLLAMFRKCLKRFF
ncbi:unnamed protein product [Lactuca saligna]|uniref:Uncharacterized protein n=1 Tax=Lactuca saligna TaxID=75948 RepID=A0AA35ZQ60_LACSI|nr:unnamed protein product [Lactuca saligna]